ncbi:MAG: RNA polymerase sigma factor [Candidatus Kapabacteria bacterium]|nr:RNA polymerase sigma factor [Candidatus Kapabacteria bacterium]
MKRRLSEYSDSELYAMLRGAEREEAFAELYARLSPNVYAYCLRVLGGRDRANDIFQETFMRFFQSAERHSGLENVRGYALTICRNLCLNEKKRVQTAAAVEFDDALYNPGVTREADRNEMLQLIHTALDLLPHDMREAFVLREYDGLPYQEIADLLNIKLDTAKVRVFRAKQRIREILEPYLNEFSRE